jgi:hypothetical protein
MRVSDSTWDNFNSEWLDYPFYIAARAHFIAAPLFLIVGVF